MAEAAQADTTLRVDSDTVATHELKQIHKMKLLDAEQPLLQIEAIGQTLVLMAGSDAFQDDEGLAKSMTFLSSMLMDESRKLRRQLYE